LTNQLQDDQKPEEAPVQPPVVAKSAPSAPKKQQGTPVWQILLVMVFTVACLIVTGVRLVPTLIPMIFPPDSPLPPGVVNNPISKENKGYGLDEFVYATNISPCTAAQYYANRLGDCTFSAGTSCEGGGMDNSGRVFVVGRCMHEDTIGEYRVTWTAYVAGGYTTDGQTRIRIVREISGSEQ
jgi:hypothetical protein